MFTDLETIGYDDIVTGEKFVRLAHYVYSHYDYRNPNPVSSGQRLLYADTYQIEELFARVPQDGEFVVMSHNADRAFTQEMADKAPASIRKVYTQNVACEDPRVHSLPIGLENERWFVDVQKKRKILHRTSLRRPASRLACLNADVGTNRRVRKPVHRYFLRTGWCTCRDGRNGRGFDRYLDDLESHFFIISPEGNGIDCHRTWEALYLNRVPVVKRNLNTRFYEHLPMLVVESWDEVTEQFLLSRMPWFVETSFETRMLRFAYWRDLITR